MQSQSNMPPLVASAAIKYHDRVYCGPSHGWIMHERHRLDGMKSMGDCEQGFVDYHGNFLNRVDACKRALECGQLQRPRYESSGAPELFSEDLWSAVPECQDMRGYHAAK